MTYAEWPYKIGSFVILLELTDVRVLIILMIHWMLENEAIF